MPVPESIRILLPWEALSEARAEVLTIRLVDDLPPGHQLCGMKLRAVAARVDRDDVLFEFEGGDSRIAVVHLTWKKENDPKWPSVRFFQNWEDWTSSDMNPSREEFNSDSN